MEEIVVECRITEEAMPILKSAGSLKAPERMAFERIRTALQRETMKHIFDYGVKKLFEGSFDVSVEECIVEATEKQGDAVIETSKDILRVAVSIVKQRRSCRKDFNLMDFLLK